VQNFIKTIINAIKSWTIQQIPKKLTELENDLYSEKNKIPGNMIDVMSNAEMNDALRRIDNAQTTADNAQATADNAQTIANNAQTTADNAQATIENHPINLQWGTYEAVIDDANLLTQEDINHQPDRFKEILSEYPDMKFYQVNRVLSFGEVSGIPSSLESVLYSSYMLYREGVSGASTLTYVHITNKNVEFLFNENGYLRSIVAYYRGKPIALALRVAIGGTIVFMPYLCYVDEYNRTMNFSCATIDNEQKMSLFPAYGGKLLFEEDAFPAIATQIDEAVAQKSQVQIITWEADD
jgi:hypothetical protein